MRRQLVHLLLVSGAAIALCSALGKSQQNPLLWIPHHVGDRLIYKYVSKDFSGIPNKPAVTGFSKVAMRLAA